MKDSFVSVVIPCYNYAEYVGEAIESALNQSCEDKEVIVVDDGSTDGSLDVIQSYEDVDWYHQENQGAPAARNYGLSKARGAFVKFVDADDKLAPQAIEHHLRAVRLLQSRRDIAFGNLGRVGEENEQNHLDSALSLKEVSLPRILRENVNTLAPLHRRELLEEVGGFRDMPRGQEYDLHLRLNIAGVRFHRFSSIVGYRRIREGNSHAGVSAKTSASEDPRGRVEYLRLAMSVLQNAFNHEIPQPLVTPIAKRWWIAGREAVRGGREDFAKRWFETARNLDRDCVEGAVIYRFIVNIFGPVQAEKIVERIKSIVP